VLAGDLFWRPKLNQFSPRYRLEPITHSDSGFEIPVPSHRQDRGSTTPSVSI
jgi:hypothetical protein